MSIVAPPLSNSLDFLSSFYSLGYGYISSIMFSDENNFVSMQLGTVEETHAYLVIKSLCIPCSVTEERNGIVQLLRFLVSVDTWELRTVIISLQSYSSSLFDSILPLLKQLTFSGVSSTVCGTDFSFKPYDCVNIIFSV